MLYVYLSLAGIVAVFVILRILLRHAPISIGQYVMISLATVFALALLILTLSGRLPWLVALIGAGIAYLVRRATGGRSWSGRLGAGNASPGNRSRVQTRFVEMTLDHDSGRMDGTVLEGRFNGRALTDLTLAELLELWSAARVDLSSTNVMEAYLDRVHPEWRSRAGDAPGDEPRPAPDQGTMDEKHALEILGLQPGATTDQIVAAHRTLMQRLHPDRGGSTYLAAKINEAKDFLLRQGQAK